MKTRVNWLFLPAVALGLGACNKKPQVKAPEVPAAAAEAAVAKEIPAPPAVPKIAAEERAAKLGFARHLPQDTEVVMSFYNGSKVAERVMGSKVWDLVQKQMKIGGDLEAPPEEEMEEPEAQLPEVEEAEEAKEAGAETEEIAADTAETMAEDVATDTAEDNAPEETPPDALVAEPAVPMPDADPAAEEDAEPVGPAALFGSEVTLALGKSTCEQMGNVLTLNNRMGYYQMRAIAKIFVAAVKAGDFSSIQETITSTYGEGLYKEVLNDPKSGIGLVEKAQMPPLYLAFRTKESERTAAAEQVSSMLDSLGMLGESVEPLSVEVGGAKFEGSKILGAKISATMAESRASMDELMGAESVDRLLAAVAKKDIVIVSGTVGDYVVVLLGGSVAEFKFASDLGQSLVSGDALAFTDGYASKDLAAVVYGEKAGTDRLIASTGTLAEYTNGLRDGLAGAEGLGETRDLEAMFQIVAEREAALRKLAGNEASGVVAFFEDGLKIESFGGQDLGAMNWKAPHQLASLGESEDVVMFANMTGDAVYSEKSRDYVEAILETAYAMTMKVAEAPIESEELVKFQGMAKIFDTKFRPDMIALWDAYSVDFGGGLGHETALVVDFKGGAPAVPGIAQALLDKVKIPRISIVSPVTDRAKLAGSWEKMNTTLTGTLAKIAEISGQEIPMQKPMTSERSGNTTYFFPMPFLTDDFVPSVTLGDKWFAASTSKNHALDMIAKAGTEGPARSGFWFSMNFKALEKYAGETLALVDENAENLAGEALPAREKSLAKEAIKLLGGLDKLTIHSRREGAVLRSSVHFKTR